MTAAEMWLAIRMPLWHRIRITKKLVVISSTTIYFLVFLLQITPEIINPGRAFQYLKLVRLAIFSDQGSVIFYRIFWAVFITGECVLTLILAILVLRIVKRRDPCKLLPPRLIANHTCHCRIVLVNFMHLIRFSLMWIVIGLLRFFLHDISEYVNLVLYLFFFIAIGDGTVFIMLLPRYKKMRDEILNRIAGQSKGLRLFLQIFI